MGGQGGRGRGNRRRHHRRAAAARHRRVGGGGFNIFIHQGGAYQGLIYRSLISSFICIMFGIGLIFYGILASIIYDFPWQGLSFIGVGVMLIMCSLVGFWKANRLAQRQREQQATVPSSQGNFGSQITTQPQPQQYVWTTGQNMTEAPLYGAGQKQPLPGYATTVGPQSYNSPVANSQQPYPQAGGPVPYTQAGGVAPYPQYLTTPGSVQPFPPLQTIANGPQLYHVQPYSASDGNTQAPYPPTEPSKGPAPNNSTAVTMPPPPSYDELVNEQNK